MVFDFVGKAVEAARLVDKGLGNIDAVHMLEMACQSLGKPAQAAAEVQRGAEVDLKARVLDLSEDVLDLGAARGEKILFRPLVSAFGLVSQDQPHWIVFTQFSPIFGGLFNFHARGKYG